MNAGISGKYDVNGVVPLILALDGTAQTNVIFNNGPSPVYISSDLSSLTIDATNGIKIPAQAYKEWPAGQPLLLKCAPNTTARVTVSVNQGGLLTAPIGQTPVVVAAPSTIGSVADGVALGPFDMSRFDSFSLVWMENSNAGSALIRDVFLYWSGDSVESDGQSISAGASIISQVSREKHTIFSQGGFMQLRGKVKAPYLWITASTNTLAIRNYRLIGYLTPTGDDSRICAYGLQNVGGGTLVPTAGTTVEEDGSSGIFRWNIPSGVFGAGVLATAYMPHSWSGEASWEIRIAGAITTTPITAALYNPDNVGSQSFAVMDFNPTTATRTNGFQSPITLPTGNIALTVNNGSAAAVSALVTVTMHDGKGI